MVEAINATVRKYSQEELEETRDDTEHVEKEEASQNCNLNAEPCLEQTDYAASVSPCKNEMPVKKVLSPAKSAVLGKSSASEPGGHEQQTGASHLLRSSQQHEQEKTSAEMAEPSSEPECGLLDSSCASPAGGMSYSDDDSLCLPLHDAASPGSEHAAEERNVNASVAVCLSAQKSSPRHEATTEQSSPVRRTSPRRKPTSPNQRLSHSGGKEVQHSPRNNNSPRKTFSPLTVHPISSESSKENKVVEKTSPLQTPADLRKLKTSSFSPKQRCKQSFSSPISCAKNRNLVPGRRQSPIQHNVTSCRVSPRRAVPQESVSYSSRLRSSLQKSESPDQKSMSEQTAVVFLKKSSQSQMCLKNSKQLCERQRKNRRASASEIKSSHDVSLGKPLRTRSRSSSRLRMERSTRTVVNVRSSSLHDTRTGRNTPGNLEAAAERSHRELGVTLTPNTRRTRYALADKLTANISHAAGESEIRGTSGAKLTGFTEVVAERDLLSTGSLSSAHQVPSDASVSGAVPHSEQTRPSTVDIGIQVSFMEVDSSLPLSAIQNKSDVGVQTSDLNPLTFSPSLFQSPLPCMCPCMCGVRVKPRPALQPDQSFMSLTSASYALTVPSNSASSPDVRTFVPACSEESILTNMSISSHARSGNVVSSPLIRRCVSTDLETPCEIQNSTAAPDISKIIASVDAVADTSSKSQLVPVATSFVSAVVPPCPVENAHDASSSMLSTFPPTPSPSLSYAADNTVESIVENCSMDTALSPSSSSSGKNSSLSDAEKPNLCLGGTESQPILYEHCAASRRSASELLASASVSIETSESVKLKSSAVEPHANLSSTKFNVMVSLPRAVSDISSCSESPRYKLRSPRPKLQSLTVSPRTNQQQLGINEPDMVSSVADSSRNRGFGCELLVCIDKRATDAFLTGSQNIPSFNSSRNTPRRNSSDSDDDEGVESCIPKDADDQSAAEDAGCEYPDESHNEKVDVDKLAFVSDKYEGMSQDYSDFAINRNMPASDSVSLCNASFSDTPSSPVALDICVIDSDRDVIIIDEEEGDGSRWNHGRELKRGNIRKAKPNSSGRRGRKRKRRHKSATLQSLGAHSQNARLHLESDCVVMLDRTIVPEVLLSHGVLSREDPHIDHIRQTADAEPSSKFQTTDAAVSIKPTSTASSAQDTSIDLNEAFNSTDLENNFSNCSQMYDVEHGEPLPGPRLTESQAVATSQLDTRDSLSSETWNDILNSEYDPLPSMKKKRRRLEEDMGYSQRRKKRRRRLHSSTLDASVTDNETDGR